MVQGRVLLCCAAMLAGFGGGVMGWPGEGLFDEKKHASPEAKKLITVERLRALEFQVAIATSRCLRVVLWLTHAFLHTKMRSV